MDERLNTAQRAADTQDWATVASILQEMMAQKRQSWDDSTQQELLGLALHCLANSHFQVRWDISKVIPHLGAIALPPLLEIVNTTEFDEEDWEHLWFAARLVGEFDHPDAIATLLALLQSDTPELVQVASDALSNRGDTVVAALATLSSQRTARLGVVQTLAKIDHPSVVGPLLSLVNDDPAEVRAIALEALMRFPDARILSVLSHALDDPSARVRQAAVTGLGIQAHRFRDPSIVPLIEPVLLDLNSQVGRQAAIALGRIGTVAALDALDRAWRSPYAPEILQHEIVQVMGYKQQAYALSILQTYLQILMASPQSNRERQQRLCQTIIATLGRAESAEVRSGAADILVNLLSMQNSITQFPPIRQAIAFSLGQLHSPQAVEALIQLLADEDVGIRLHAIAALKQIAPVDALKRLEQLTQECSTSPNLQQGAAFALMEWSQ